MRAYSSHQTESLVKDTEDLVRKTKEMLKGVSSHGDPGLWKKLTFFLAVPLITISTVNCYLMHKEHGHQRAEFVPYEHMRIMSRRFPWGDGKHSFFHNKHMNALQDGYEE